MNLLEAIDARCSRRSYDGEALTPEDADFFRTEIEKINNATGLNCTYVEDASEAFSSFGATYGMFSGVKSVIVLKGLKSTSHLYEKVGYYGEKLILEATSRNLGTCWVGGTYENKDNVLGAAEDEEIVCVITIGKVSDRMSVREKVVGAIVQGRKAPQKRYAADIEEVPAWFEIGIKAVVKAPSARNTQKPFFTLKSGIVRVSVPDDYRFDLTDLGIAKLHFEIAAGGKFALGNNAVLMRDE